tara:strand:- start:582 stop:773 length:192 start_codon:yes stop_codon:yes gene_type:complete
MKNETLTQLYKRLVIDTKGTEAHIESKALYMEIKKAILESTPVVQKRRKRGLEDLAKRENQRE